MYTSLCYIVNFVISSTQKIGSKSLLRQINEVTEDIHLYGNNASELEAICFLLASMPVSYASIISSFREINEEQLPSMDIVESILLDYSLKSTDKMPNTSQSIIHPRQHLLLFLTLIKSFKKKSGISEKKEEKQTNKLHCNFYGKNKIM